MSEPISILPIPRVSLTSTAAEFDRGLDYRGWVAAGRQLGCIAGAGNFWIGDWIEFGARNAECGSKHDGDNAWSKYAEALEVTGLDHDFLRILAYVARNVAVPQRRPELTFQHHREVAALTVKEQKMFLARAVKGNDGQRWTVSELRQAIRSQEGQLADGREPDPGLMKWARPAGDLTRYLKAEDSRERIEDWPAERKAAVRLALKDAKELMDRIWTD